MPYQKSTLLLMNLVSLCLFTACQTMPSGQPEAMLESTTPPPETIEVVQVQANDEQEQVSAANMPLIAEQVQEIVDEIAEEMAPKDLISRMVAGFSLETPQDPRVEQELNYYRKHPRYIQRIQERAEPYLHFILEEIRKRDMPTEIALLPAVESAYRPFAYSHGRAAGMWQFIPSTGRIYGLKQNWWYDGRRDAVSSTLAALDYLQSLNKQFKGDWELALAAYSSGGGTVRSAIRRNKKKGSPTDFWSLKLPDETSVYVPRLLALVEVFRNPQEHGANLLVFPDEPYFETIDLGSQLDLALAAEMADLPIQDLYLLNSGFNRWATDPDGPHRLNLPLDKVERFKCSQCHNDKAVTTSRAAEIAHGDIVLVHGGRKKPLSCFTCHNKDERDFLVTEESVTIDIDHSYQLCDRCHFREKKDWVGGAHGKRVSYWAGKRVVKNCTSCHDPHSPRFEKRWPKTYSPPFK